MIVGIGFDLVEIDRVERMLTSLGARMLARLFTQGEAAYIQSKGSPAQHAAVRLAAKEAMFKALSGTPRAREISWRDAEVTNDWDGAPTMMLHGVAKARADELGVVGVFVSLTHTRTTAGAMVVLER